MLKKIMVIDDSEIDLYLAEHIITNQQFASEVMSFDFAGDAVQYLNAHSDAPHALPEYILLDVNMPGMNGFEFLDAFHALPASVTGFCRIVMLTTSLDSRDRKRAFENPYVKHFVNKPLTRETLSGLSSEQL